MTPLQSIGWPPPTRQPAAWAALLRAHPQARPARIAEQHRSGYIVAEGPEEGYPAESLPDWQRPPGYRKGMVPPEARAAVGDWVLVEGEGASAKIVALLPRWSAIKRGAAGEHYKQQLIAANIDVVLVVSGLDADFNPRRIERYLLLVGGSGATPVVVLTKADKVARDPRSADGAAPSTEARDAPAPDPEAGRAPDAAADQAPSATIASVDDAKAALADIVGQGVAVVAVNARDRASVAALEPWLGTGTTAVLVGSSGAGKSTVTNTLLGVERMRTGAVRERDDRGRHTTTHRALIPLPSGACLIDTPGMRELKPTGEEDVAESFTDVEALAAQCRFRDCAHAREPGCAVQAAVQAGTLDRERAANFLKLRDEVAGAADRLANRRMQKTDDKSQGKAPGRRPEGKHGRH